MEYKCPVCGNNGKLKSLVINGKYISERCTNCIIDIGAKIERGVSSSSAEYDRERQREDFRADIAQPYIGNKPNREFALAYPDKVKDYYSDKEIGEMGI